MFPSTMAQVEEEAWVAFTNVVSGFLGKKKDPEYGRLVNDMLENFEKILLVIKNKVNDFTNL
ncbi:DNA-directed RNA polymerase II subunit [Trichinella pseudospiralis]